MWAGARARSALEQVPQSLPIECSGAARGAAAASLCAPLASAAEIRLRMICPSVCCDARRRTLRRALTAARARTHAKALHRSSLQ